MHTAGPGDAATELLAPMQAGLVPSGTEQPEWMGGFI